MSSVGQLGAMAEGLVLTDPRRPTMEAIAEMAQPLVARIDNQLAAKMNTVLTFKKNSLTSNQPDATGKDTRIAARITSQ